MQIGHEAMDDGANNNRLAIWPFDDISDAKRVDREIRDSDQKTSPFRAAVSSISENSAC